MASSPRAASATLRPMTPVVASPAQSSPRSGPLEMRPRDGFNPTTPQHDAGMRIDPPPSPPWPSAHKPAATAAAAPPLDPPAVPALPPGFRPGGHIAPSVTAPAPNPPPFRFPP